MQNSRSPISELGVSYLKRMAIVWGILLGIGVLVLFLTWNAFFTYVPPGKHLVIMAKDGDPMPPDQVLAERGQKGTQREVLGEGWHFILPIAYTTELEENTIIWPGKVGIVTALGGKPLPQDRVLAEEGEKGIQRQVLPPGAYRLNLHGYQVEQVDAVRIDPGYVGVQQRRLGTEGKGRFAEGPDEKGILREVLQPGLYYLNTHEFKIIPVEVGIFQTTYQGSEANSDKALTFNTKGFPMSMDCTIEWEVLPENMPALVAQYPETGLQSAVEKNVIDLEAHKICRNKGLEYGVDDFLVGSKRQKFQDDFSQELTRVCKEKNVTVHSAFIRHISIPETYMKQVRDRQIAEETNKTNLVRDLTLKSDNDVSREEQMIDQKVKEVQFETERIVAGINIEAKNIESTTDAQIKKMTAEYEAQIAKLQAEQRRTLGEAEAQAKKLKETAVNNLLALKLQVFQNDGNAFLRYSLADKLNPKLIVRLFHSGAGTLWTNMDGKGMNLLLPAPGTPTVSADKTVAGGEEK
jgi:regulator of protease activity HflC (stomatin/prohibitin superfamily)